MEEVSDDDFPKLPPDTLAALKEFYNDEEEKKRKEMEKTDFEENWQLSQFWYDDQTADSLAKEALKAAGSSGRIACISCPTIYRKIKKLQEATTKENDHKVVLLEHDKRFECFGEDFLYYDYKEPLNFPEDLKSCFDVVLADPPFLSQECLEKVAETIKFLTKDKIILCTGAVMEDAVGDLLGLHTCKFRPTHEKKLANEFKCYSNYELDIDFNN